MTAHHYSDLPPIVLSRHDRKRLAHLAEAAFSTYPDVADYLAREVERAAIVDDYAPDIVAMESEVRFLDRASGRERRVTLVYPDRADAASGRISVLTPIGAALIGMSVGASIEFETPAGESRSLQILSADAPR
jgi:regulator of nucleoside diphosphate kinase